MPNSILPPMKIKQASRSLPILLLLFASTLAHQACTHIDFAETPAQSSPQGQHLCIFGQMASLSRKYLAATASANTRVWLFSAMPMVLVVSFEQLLANTDVLMLGVLEGPAETGVYHVGVRIVGIALFVFFAVSAFAAPRIAELHSKNAIDELIVFAGKVRLAVALPTMLGLAILALIGQWLLGLFGAQFADAYYPMMMLSIAVAARALAGPVDNLMTMTGKQNQLARVLGIVAILNLVANALLIPRFGILGAAMATSGSIVTEMIWVSILAGRHIGFRPWLLRPVKVN
jgi:O-antigen/teichoic acid export membrane protein